MTQTLFTLYRCNFWFLKPGFHIVVSDGDVPASTGTWRRCIGDAIKSWTELNFSNLDWDVVNITIKTFPYHHKRPSSIADPLTGTRPHHLRRMETRLNRSCFGWKVFTLLRCRTVVVVVVYFILSRLLYLAFSANLGLLCMPHPGMGPLV